MEEARTESGNSYTYVGRPGLEGQVARRPSWAWCLLAAPLLLAPFFHSGKVASADTEAATQAFDFGSQFNGIHAVHAIHTGSEFGGLSGEMIDAGPDTIDGTALNRVHFHAGAAPMAGTMDHSALDGVHWHDGGAPVPSTIDGPPLDGLHFHAGDVPGHMADIDGINSVNAGSIIAGVNAFDAGSAIEGVGPVFHHGTHTVHTGTKEIVVKHHYLTQEKAVHVPVPVPGADHIVVDKVYTPHSHYSCGAASGSSSFWSAKHKAWCCWKFQVGCPSLVVNQDKYIHVAKTNRVPVPHYYNVPVPSHAPEPVRVPTPIPSMPLPPKEVQVPVPLPGRIPPPVVHYQYHAMPEPYKVSHVIYDKVPVPQPVTVKKFVKDFVPERPEVIYKTHHVMVPEAHLRCDEGSDYAMDVWSKSHQRYCCWKEGIACPSTHYKTRTRVKTHIKYVKVPVPTPPKVIVRKHEEQNSLESFDCSQGFSNWWMGWSPRKKKYCCAHENRGCPGASHGHFHVAVHVASGSATGAKTYDCNAGFSNWLQGWSDSKKTWCCGHGGKGCVKHHCFTGDISSWAQDKKEWCCSTYQRGCPHTTLSPLGCDAVCVLSGESSSCKDRIHWVKHHVFGEQENSCNLAYSKVQVDCDVCRGCSSAAAGCAAVVGVATSAAFDCNAALNNFARAWSPPKKQWCCSKEGKGCEGNNPPAVSAGAGMMWKHVKVSGFWTWTAVHAGGAVAAPAQPYDCHAGLANWKLGWSDPKKAWCCSSQKMGCPGSPGGMGAGGTSSSSWSVHWTSSHGKPPSAAGNGMMWIWQNHHWTQAHFTGRDVAACHSGHVHLPFCCYKYGIC